MVMANKSSPPARSAKSASLRIVLKYSFLAAAWILFSDKLVALLSSNQSINTTLSIFKGWFFVAITSFILYQLIHRHFAAQEEASRKIVASEEKFSRVFDSSPVAIGIGSREDGRLIDVNKAWLEMFGYERTEVVGRTTSDLGLYVHSGQRKETIQMLLDSGCVKNRELRLRRKSGELFDVLYSAELIEFAQHPYLLVMMSDISERKNTEDALQGNEERMRLMGDNLPDSYVYQYTFDEDGTPRFLYLSSGVERLHGISSEEVLYDAGALFRQVEPEQMPALAAMEAASRQSMTDFAMELRMRRADGEWRWIQVCSRPRWNASGRLVWDGMATDITDRKRVEAYRTMGWDILHVLNDEKNLHEAIKEIIGIVRQAAEVDAVGIRLQHEDDFPYFYQEGFPQDFLQKENSLLTRNRDGGICRDESGNVCLECTCGLVITGKTDPANPLFTAGGSSWTNDSFPFLHVPSDQDPRDNPRDECIHQGFASVALIPIRAKGSVVGLLQLNDHRKDRFTLEGIKALEDIAENIGEAMLRKQAECELRKSKNLILNLIQSTDQGIFGVSMDGCCTFINRAALTMLGYEAEECLGRNMHDLLHHTHANGSSFPEENCPLCRAREAGEGCRLDNEVLWRSDGTFIYAEYSSYPVMENGVLSGAVVTFSDISDRRRAEEERHKLETQLYQAQKMESIGCLAGSVAHDFNNKLSVILGHAELLLMQIIPDQVRDSLEEILNATNQSADLTRQLLAFARKQTIEPKVLDLNETISSLLKMLQRLIGEDIHLSWLPGDNLYLVSADPSQVDQILANLCVNARDAIADVGKITIETRNRMFDDDYCTINPGFVCGDYVEIAVSDNGCGMDRETQSQIFEPFFTTKAIGKGTGLGLATVYGIVKQNRGFINLYSEPGHGTTFKIYLPRYENAERPVHTEVAIKQYLLGEETILLVEDEPSILKMTVMLLENQGYNLLAADSPDKAIELAKEHGGEIHLLLTDVVMPGMNGRDLARRLQEIHPRLKCLYMSGYTANVIAHHGVLDEGVYFIQKPFSLPALTAKLHDVLDGT